MCKGPLLRLALRARAGYGFADWLVFDATVVRGLAYYTGTVFEAFDRGASLRCAPGTRCAQEGACSPFARPTDTRRLRAPAANPSAICGGGRYDRLLSSYGGEDAPCAGFGFGDAVIVELLAERGLLPKALAAPIDDVVAPLEEALRPAAARVAAALRAAGRRVDLVLEPKKRSWVLKRATSAAAARLVLLGGDEWARGAARVKLLDSREEADVPLQALLDGAADAPRR